MKSLNFTPSSIREKSEFANCHQTNSVTRQIIFPTLPTTTSFLFFCYLVAFLFTPSSIMAQCLDNENGIIWKSKNSTISFEELAEYAAPMLWFSPDEIDLANEEGQKLLPNAFPFEKSDGKPIVYYKIRNVYSQFIDKTIPNNENQNRNLRVIDLKNTTALDLDYYYYFLVETGLGSHPHDIESVTLQVEIINITNCPDYSYGIKISKVTGRAHGLHWFNNVFTVDQQTFFPLSILLEEGKHASCTDKNADGVYTPTYDVTEKVNDAWGVRDIITSGRLVSGGFQAWMAKKRDPSSIVFPPLPEDSPHYDKFQKRFGDFYKAESMYELRPYPNYEELKKKHIIKDKKLEHLMVGKKPHDWPAIEKISGDGAIKRWSKTSKAGSSISFAYRWDETRRISIALPLLLFKNVEAPMTGGWLYHKLYVGGWDTNSIANDSTFQFKNAFGHQIVYTSSASKWVDTYLGFGYELYDVDFELDRTKYKAFFASEIGVKFRVNVSKTPLKFLSKLGTKYWGVRLGWKNVGFSPFENSGFVIEVGAGVF